MKILIAGGGGQVARALARTAPTDHGIESLARSQLDLTDHDQVMACIAEKKPSVVINAAAYTAVDRAETERERAYAVNASGVAILAKACRSQNCKLIHLSTDYVFDGKSSHAYDPAAATHPVNEYGGSKLAGERAIAETTDLDWLIVRTSWVYSPWGNNFLLTMLRLMRERGAVSVVDEQVGAPTSALNLARFLWRLISLPKHPKILHYTDAGVASWYDFAVAIAEEAVAFGLLQQAAKVKGIPSADYPTPAKRPAFSLLATRSSLKAAGFSAPHWRGALRETLEVLREA